ncbi:hypothetical protein [Pleurocapsa sp. FMAR1]|uniref:hypothetical protein n=1 Tax=Pleurocapsa sp. FMAR1 TaxID=3040204 RepID=UPI0029C7F73E|nr:hypothetical protein [Pleurocapsa sp. FMAR1]
MTNPETKAQYEGAILNQLVKNIEKVAVIEVAVKQNTQKLDNIDQRLNNIDQRLTNIESLLGWLKVIGGAVLAIALSLIANFVYSFLIN